MNVKGPAILDIYSFAKKYKIEFLKRTFSSRKGYFNGLFLVVYFCGFSYYSYLNSNLHKK